MIEFLSATGYGLLDFILESCALSLSPLFNLQSIIYNRQGYSLVIWLGSRYTQIGTE
ncbi:MAG: hypothetical protein P8075_12980 [Deltaproteobacteria bacterium]|jgi:hypothetical protein